MISATATPEKPPAFRTVLAVSNNPDDYLNQGVDPEDEVKYQGPMYFDLDGPEIGEVITSAQSLIRELGDKWNVPLDQMNCWLSGKKGVHITLPEELFGLRGQHQYLPWMYRKFAEEFPYEHIDRGVYSMGKGRMWRCSNIKRPDTGTFKIQVSVAEMLDMTAEMYQELVSEPRGDLGLVTPGSAIPQLESFIKTARELVRKQRNAQKKAAVNISREEFQSLTEIPGCIYKLITEGDCPASNWNQASIQLATYIAAKYSPEDSDEFEQALVEPFVRNVQSATRPTEKERRQSLKDQLHRAFQGQLKFGSGAVISTIGTPCGECIVCSPIKVQQKTNTGEVITDNGVKFANNGVFQLTEQGQKVLFTDPIEVIGLYKVEEPTTEGQVQQVLESYRCRTQGIIVDITSDDLRNVRMLNECMRSTSNYYSGGEQGLVVLSKGLEGYCMIKEIEPQVRSKQAGITLQQTGKGEVPHLITRGQSFTRGGLYSEYIYSGQPSLAPDFSNVETLTAEDGEALAETLKAVFRMNEPSIIVPAVSWFVATHLKTYLTKLLSAFPMLNLCGGSHSGKSATLFILQTMNSFPYRQAPVWNAEVDTIYPLEEMISSSTTIVRIVEEANESTAKRKWPQLVGILKSSWDAQGIKKGTLQGRKVGTVTMKNDAPIVYLSEQSFPIQSVRTRSISCHMSPANLENKEYTSNHKAVITNINILERFAKNLSAEALNLNLPTLRKWVDEAEEDLPPEYNGRTQISYTCLLVGLKFLAHVARKFSSELVEEIDNQYAWLLTHLEGEEEAITQEKKQSATDDIIAQLDTMAAEAESQTYGLECGRHYWRQGTLLYLEIPLCFPRYRRYIRSLGLDSMSSIVNPGQWADLLERESYFHSKMPHPERPGTVHVLDLEKLRHKGVNTSNFQEGEPD